MDENATSDDAATLSEDCATAWPRLAAGSPSLPRSALRHGNVSQSSVIVRLWVQKYEAGAFDDDAAAVDVIQEYKARIAALERLVGRRALELAFLKGLSKTARGREAGLCP